MATEADVKSARNKVDGLRDELREAVAEANASNDSDSAARRVSRLDGEAQRLQAEIDAARQVSQSKAPAAAAAKPQPAPKPSTPPDSNDPKEN